MSKYLSGNNLTQIILLCGKLFPYRYLHPIPVYCCLLHLLSSVTFGLHHEKTQHSANAKTKRQVSFAVTAHLIIAFIFATQIEQFLYFLNPTVPLLSKSTISFCACTGQFVSDLFGNHIVCFLMTRLICFRITSVVLCTSLKW